MSPNLTPERDYPDTVPNDDPFYNDEDSPDFDSPSEADLVIARTLLTGTIALVCMLLGYFACAVSS